MPRPYKGNCKECKLALVYLYKEYDDRYEMVESLLIDKKDVHFHLLPPPDLREEDFEAYLNDNEPTLP